jgi:hypothetical protein
VVNHDEDILPTVRSAPAAFDTPSFQPLATGPVDFHDRVEKEVEFPRKDDSMSKLYILTPLPGKGQGLIAAQDISKGTRILCESPLLTTAYVSSADQFESSIAGKLSRLAEPQQ